MRWEVLRNAVPDYLVLSAARRLFRVAADPSSPELGIRTFPNPLRFVACLSPATTDSTDEFNGLVAAADAGRKAGLPLELVLYVGQRELVQSAPPWATCKLMPSKTENADELKLQRPHILHFFCHGQSELPQALQFATVAEQRAGVPEGSVLLSMDRIVEAHLLDPTWIVIFNCCDGGRPGEALASMAYRAVANRAFLPPSEWARRFRQAPRRFSQPRSIESSSRCWPRPFPQSRPPPRRSISATLSRQRACRSTKRSLPPVWHSRAGRFRSSI